MSTAPSVLVAATRRSALALAQTRAFLRDLVAQNPGLDVSELLVTTSGDRIQDRPLSEVGGKGLFVKEIEEALLDGRAHLAVHSMKDLPAQLPDPLFIGCVPRRADPRDVLLLRPGLAEAATCRSLQAEADARPDGARWLVETLLPSGARVGSSSLRRRSALLAVRSDLLVEPLRGNVDTRLRKLAAREYDAILLAAAGLARLGLSAETLPAHVALPTGDWLPAVAQGLLAIELHQSRTDLQKLLSKLEDRSSRLQAEAERGVLRALGADCTVPLAAHARIDGSRMILSARLSRSDSRHAEITRDAVVVEAAEAEALGREVGRLLSEA